METTQEIFRERVLEEIARNPSAAKSFITTLVRALEASHEVLYDLTWERGGKLDPHFEEYVSNLNKINSEILESING